MADFLRVNRRLFLANLGKGTLAMAVFGACADTPETSVASSTTAPATEARFERVNLGFVSAYIVVRGSEGAIVDTGVSGSEGEIEAALAEVGLGWNQIGHVILTHRHPDHIGSAPAVLEAAANSTGYAGVADLGSVTSPRELTSLADGDTVFGLDVVATPGHTAGHICMLDPVAGVLVAGDALVGADGGVNLPEPQFSSDHDEALRSVGKLASLAYEQILFGHGEPVTEGGAEMVLSLAAGL